MRKDLTPEDLDRLEELVAKAARLTQEIDAALALKSERSDERAEAWEVAHEVYGATFAELGSAAGVHPSQVDKAIRRARDARAGAQAVSA